MKTAWPFFAARRDPATKRWFGWVQFKHAGPITETPDDFATKAEAVAAIKERV